MKKLVLFAVAIVAISFASCTGGAKNAEEDAKRVADSIAKVAEEEAAKLQEQVAQDSTALTVAAAQDSTATAEKK